jgi:DNA-directed RNA polymerase specialized sigma24 family protein
VVQAVQAQGLVKAESGNLKAEIEAVSDNEAGRVFALMKALDDGQRKRKAPLSRVFRLLVLEGLSQAAAAKQCRCSPGLVSARVAEIERRMGRPVTELRALASRLGEMDVATADDSRARKIYRRGLVDDTEEEDES